MTEINDIGNAYYTWEISHMKYFQESLQSELKQTPQLKAWCFGQAISAVIWKFSEFQSDPQFVFWVTDLYPRFADRIFDGEDLMAGYYEERSRQNKDKIDMDKMCDKSRPFIV